MKGKVAVGGDAGKEGRAGDEEKAEVSSSGSHSLTAQAETRT